jgi:hypothetical protein
MKVSKETVRILFEIAGDYDAFWLIGLYAEMPKEPCVHYKDGIWVVDGARRLVANISRTNLFVRGYALTKP